MASLVLLADHRSGRRAGWLPWAALVTGAAGSLAANVATAGPDAISKVIAGWPALALLIAVKLLAAMLNRPAAFPPVPGTSDDETTRPAVPRPSRAVLVRPAAVSAARRGPGPPGGQAPGVAELLPAARAARDELRRDGHRLTRDALASRLRASGHPVRNSRLTPLLQALRSETPAPDPARKAA